MRTLLRSLIAALIIFGVWAPPLPARAYPAAGKTFIVNSTLDRQPAPSAARWRL
jgi:hypothetical protein